MPRLDLTHPADDEIMNGSFGAASMSLELVRLRNRVGGPAFPTAAGGAVVTCLEGLAQAFERLAQARDSSGRARILEQARTAVAAAWTTLIGLPVAAGTKDAVEVAHALASLHFIADRLDIDRAFLTRTIAGAVA